MLTVNGKKQKQLFKLKAKMYKKDKTPKNNQE